MAQLYRAWPVIRLHIEANPRAPAAGAPKESPDEGLVFVTERGYAVNGSWLTKPFQALLDRAGLPKMRLHDFRH